MRKNIFIVIVVVCFIFPGFPGYLLFPQDAETDAGVDFIEQLEDDASINWTTKVVRVKGNGFGPENVKELGRRKILAKRAAKMDAYRNLLEVIKGVQVTSRTSVEDMMLESDSIKTRTGGMLKGMRVKDVTYSNDGGCEVTVEVDIDQDGQFLLAALSAGEVKVIDNYPKFDWAAMRKNLEKTRTKLGYAQSRLTKTHRDLRKKEDLLKKKQRQLETVQALYTLLAADFKKRGEELNDARQMLAIMEKRLKDSDADKSRLKTQLVSAVRELIRTKDIVGALTQKLINQEIKFAVHDKELEMTKRFLLEKKIELNNLWSEMEKYNNAVISRLDRGKVLRYVQRIKKIQLETTERLHPFSRTVIPQKTGPQVPLYPPAPPGGHTGVLVDARGLDVKPALAPSILNDRKEKMYGVGVMPTGNTGGAIVDYLRGNIDAAKNYKKLGGQPLVVKGIEVVNGSDIMIDNEDAQKVASIPDLLEQQKVAILREVP